MEGQQHRRKPSRKNDSNEKKLKRKKKAYDNPESFNILPIVLTDVQNDSKEAESEVAQKNNLVIGVFIRNKEIRKTHVGIESRGSTKNQNKNTTVFAINSNKKLMKWKKVL